MSRPAWINVGGQDSVGTATVTASTDTLTITSHGLSNGDIVMVENLTGGADGPLIEGAVYFVRNVAGDDFQLSGTRGSQIKEFDSDGSADVLVAVPRYNSQVLRLNDTALMFHGSADRLGARQGIRPGGDPVISVTGTDWTVHDHSGVVYPGITSTSGPYRYHQLEETDSLDPADGTNDRVDALDLLIEDDDEDGTGFRRSRVVYTAGTPGNGEPDPVSNALRLGTILVPSGGSPSVASTGQFTVASGGILPIRDSGEMPGDGLYRGLTVFQEDLTEFGLLMVRTALDNLRPASHMVQLDQVSLSGTVGTGTALTIPSQLRGTFRSYYLEVDADVGESNEPIVVLVNGLADDNYRSVASVFDEDLTVITSSELNGTSFPRTGYMGQFGGLAKITLRPRSIGDTGFVGWSGSGYVNSGGTTQRNFLSGGRWNGSIQEIQNFTIRTTSGGHTWGSNANATLWGIL